MSRRLQYEARYTSADELREEIRHLLTDKAKLREALEPLAFTHSNIAEMELGDDAEISVRLRVGDFRHASEVYKETGGDDV